MNLLSDQVWNIHPYRLTGVKMGETEDLAICFPGFSLSAQWMSMHYPALFQQKTCFILNWPGLGEESLVDTPFDLEILGDWLAEIISSKNWRSISLICHSFGARVGLLLLEKHKFDHVILIAPVLKIRIWEPLMQFVPMLAYQPIVAKVFSENFIEKSVKIADRLGWLSKEDKIFLYSHFNSPKMIQFLRHYAIAIKQLKLPKAKIMRIIKDMPECKIYLFTKDKFCDNEFWEELARLNKNCELIIKKAGHFGRLR